MFVGTKRQAQETVHDEAIRCGMPYVTERWLGGLLTNWSTMHQRIVELERMEKLFSTGEIEKLTKKEGLLIQREINRLNLRLSGVRNMNHLPDLVFVIDVDREYAAVHEANLLKIPVIALVDTNCDPANVDYVIPSNDDAIRAIKLLVAKMADAVEEGKAMRKDEELEAEAAAARLPEDTTEAARKLAHSTIDMDEELQDTELLGESTLAKLAPAPSVDDVPATENPVEKDSEEGK
jgi:small subunit ribosomal protein S2